MLVNGWEGVRSFADWEAPLSAGVQPADAYKGGVSWRGLAERLSWQSFSWAQSEEQLAAAWLEHVGLEALPHSIAWPLLLIDTALLMRWEGADLGSASPPPIDAYPMFDATKGSTKGATHHEAWLPLALLMALNGEDCAPYTIFPYAPSPCYAPGGRARTLTDAPPPRCPDSTCSLARPQHQHTSGSLPYALAPTFRLRPRPRTRRSQRSYMVAGSSCKWPATTPSSPGSRSPRDDSSTPTRTLRRRWTFIRRAMGSSSTDSGHSNHRRAPDVSHR